MKRNDLEHILRASKGVTGEVEFIVIGSQAILGRFPDAPRELRQSMELDVYPKLRPELSPEIEGSLGRYSPFDATFGYHADGVSPTTATLPAGWEERRVKMSNENTRCHRLVPRPAGPRVQQARRAARKRSPFIVALIRHKLVKPSRVEHLIESSPNEPLRERLGEAWAICRERASGGSREP